MIGIIDYGAGNLLSVKKALDYIGAQCKIISSRSEFQHIDKLVLPGVGAFRAAINKIKAGGLFEHINEWLRTDRPFLGICLGLQVLFEESEEAAGTSGFDIFKGRVLRFTGKKVPQMGWNRVKKVKDIKLFDNIKDESFFYFLHGYYIQPEMSEIIAGVTEYSVTYPSAVQAGNIMAVQFHPEKSGENGLQLLRNWVNLC